MRIAGRMLVALGLFACTDQAPTEAAHHRSAPPTLSVSATTRVVSPASGAAELEVSAALRNGTTAHISVIVGGQCPLPVRIFPDPTGEYVFLGMMACASGGPTLDLAPGDTAVVTRVFGTDTLASFAPGRYGVNVTVTTQPYLIGVWAGSVQLPLAGSR